MTDEIKIIINFVKIVIGAYIKHLFLLLCLSNLLFCSNELNKNDFIIQNYIPFQESNISFGFKSFYGLVNDQMNIKKCYF